MASALLSCAGSSQRPRRGRWSRSEPFVGWSPAPESAFIPATRSPCRSSRRLPITAFASIALTLAASKFRRTSRTSPDIQLQTGLVPTRVGRDHRTFARRRSAASASTTPRRAQPSGSADHGRQRGAVGLPDSDDAGIKRARRAAQDDSDSPSDSAAAGRQAHRAVSRRIASKSATPSASTIRSCGTSADDADQRTDVRGRDRAGTDVRLPQGSRDAAPARPRAGRLARERDRPRRDRRANNRSGSRTSSSATRFWM